MTHFSKISRLPQEARLWLYACDRVLTPSEQDFVMTRVQAFMDTWTSHGRPVLAAAELIEGRLLGIAAVVEEADISGCGIDKSVHILEGIGRAMDFRWMTGLSIAYRTDKGEVQVVERPEFRALVAAGRVLGTTPVIDLSLTQVADLGRIEQEARETWHSRVFGIPSTNLVA
ncbi:MAG: hypothetical protein JJ896_18065 [Rhodothermales bacterium]|nr:hypothetical protein [Rhodothermales bacterium]MBO6781570.1 hypothetical protein [Rhodothermales bacterium]